MQFKAGDYVVHPTYGVGNIVRLEEKRLAEDQLRLYYVVMADKSTLWVPVDDNGASGLREMTSKRELARYRDVLKSRPKALERDHHKRRLEISERLKQGSFLNLCEVVRDLAGLGWQKPLSEVDATSFHRFRDSLCREWAVAAGTTIPEAAAEVESLLAAARQSYKS